MFCLFILNSIFHRETAVITLSNIYANEIWLCDRWLKKTSNDVKGRFIIHSACQMLTYSDFRSVKNNILSVVLLNTNPKSSPDVAQATSSWSFASLCFIIRANESEGIASLNRCRIILTVKVYRNSLSLMSPAFVSLLHPVGVGIVYIPRLHHQTSPSVSVTY